MQYFHIQQINSFFISDLDDVIEWWVDNQTKGHKFFSRSEFKNLVRAIFKDCDKRNEFIASI